MSVIEVSWASLAWMVCCTAGRSGPLTWRFSVLAKALLHPGAAGLERDVALLVHHAQGLAAAGLLGQPLACALPGQALVGAEVHQRAVLLVGVDARVEHHAGMPGLGRLLQGRPDRVGVGQRHRDAVDLAVDGVLDQRGLLARVGVVGVLQVDAVLLGGLLGAGPDPVPERGAGASWVTMAIVKLGPPGRRHRSAGGVLGAALAAAGGDGEQEPGDGGGDELLVWTSVCPFGGWRRSGDGRARRWGGWRPGTTASCSCRLCRPSANEALRGSSSQPGDLVEEGAGLVDEAVVVPGADAGRVHGQAAGDVGVVDADDDPAEAVGRRARRSRPRTPRAAHVERHRAALAEHLELQGVRVAVRRSATR